MVAEAAPCYRTYSLVLGADGGTWAAIGRCRCTRARRLAPQLRGAAVAAAASGRAAEAAGTPRPPPPASVAAGSAAAAGRR